MSDPVTNVEIEDVLSSIRRLVSNAQSDRLNITVPPTQEDEEPGPGRLVLTPALRVDDPLAETQAPTTEAAVLDAAEAEETEPEVQSVWTDTVEPEAEAAFQNESEPEGIEAEEAQTDDAPDVPSELSAQAAEFEALVAGRDDQWEPDGASDDDYAGDAAASTLRWSETHEVEAELEEDEATPSADPDWDEADDLASDRHVQDWQDADAEAVRPTPAGASEQGEGLVLDDAVLDEEALRDLVAEIVRQELQGALGERITRNVRKLVRREIHRALTSQDFD
jgi:hypothetical protein